MSLLSYFSIYSCHYYTIYYVIIISFILFLLSYFLSFLLFPSFFPIPNTGHRGFDHPLSQFNALSYEIMEKLIRRNASVDMLRDMSASDIGAYISNGSAGGAVRMLAWQVPRVEMEATVQPITRCGEGGK